MKLNRVRDLCGVVNKPEIVILLFTERRQGGRRPHLGVGRSKWWSLNSKSD